MPWIPVCEALRYDAAANRQTRGQFLSDAIVNETVTFIFGFFIESLAFALRREARITEQLPQCLIITER